MFKKLLAVLFPLLMLPQSSQAAVTNEEMDCLFNWAERSYAQLFSPAQAPSNETGPYYYRFYSGTNAYLGVDKNSQHAVFLAGGAMQDLGDVAPFISAAGCGSSSSSTTTTPATGASYAGTWTWSAGAYYSVQFVLTQSGSDLTATIPSTGQHFTGKLSGTTAVFTEDDGKATAQATVTLVSTNAVDLRMDSCSPTLMCMLQAGTVIRLTR